MANDHANNPPSSPQPDAELEKLEKLVGKWKISGGVQGTVKFE
jgi:hypothetical protein